MPTFKTDYIFSLGKQGWIETWYMTAGSARGALDAATGDKLLKRKGLLGKGATIEAVRVSDVAVWGDTLVKGYGPAAAVGKVDLMSDIPGASVLARVEAGPLYRRGWLVRGVPDDWLGVDPVSGMPGFADPGALSNALIAFAKAAATTPEFMLKVVLKAGRPRYNVKNVEPVGGLGSKLRFTTTTPNGLGIGQLVTVSRVRYEGSAAPGTVVNGRHYVSSAPAADQVEFEDVLADPSFNYIGGGTLHRYELDYVDVTDIIPIRPGIRRTGRALFVPAGRRRARR